ncbi:DUF1869 domain-containing protein [Rahnella bruchi]
MEIAVENRGYTLSATERKTQVTAEKVFLKPMSLYISGIASKAVAELVDSLGPAEACTLTVTNNNNGISVDRNFSTQTLLTTPAVAAEAVKELINIVRGYDEEEDNNVCGW